MDEARQPAAEQSLAVLARIPPGGRSYDRWLSASIILVPLEGRCWPPRVWKPFGQWLELLTPNGAPPLSVELFDELRGAGLRPPTPMGAAGPPQEAG